MIDFMKKKNAPLTKSWICETLDLPRPTQDEVYTKIYFAHEVQPGGVAILSVNTSDPTTVTSHGRAIELADQAMNRGAKLLLSTFQVKDYPCLIVDNVLDAYSKVVIRIRNQFSPRTIGITGSIGKTTTTQMVYSVISYKYNTHRNDSSANNMRLAAGIIQNLKTEHEYYVQEIMEGPPYRGASPISKMVQPEAAVVTLVGSSHMETFGSQERILESCLSIQDGMPENGLLILNADDPFQWNAKCERKTVFYAINNEKADYRAVNIHSDGKALLFDVLHHGVRTPIRLHCFGRHNVLDAVAAFAAGKWAGMQNEEIAAGLDRFRTEGIRQNFVHYGGKNLYLDCYNAAPESIKVAFDAVMMIPVKNGGRRIAVLGDIKESGEKEREFHLAVGEMVANSSIDELVCYGENSRLIAGVVLQKSSIPVFQMENQAELVDFLQGKVTNDDVVMFKGSHSMALEHAVDLAYGTWFHEVFDQYEFRTSMMADDQLKYRRHPDHATVIEKLTSEESVFVPDYVEGVPVTSIGRSAFNNSKSLKTIRLPSGLKNIRYLAFYKANGLRSIQIPGSTWIIDESAFNSCENLTHVKIEEGCKHLGYRAFGNCRRLESIVIPPSVCQIGNEAFLNCSNLTIRGLQGSYAEQYALQNGIRFETIDIGEVSAGEEGLASAQKAQPSKPVSAPRASVETSAPEKKLVISKVTKLYQDEKIKVAFHLSNDAKNAVLWYQFDREFEQDLCDDRCDAAVVTLLLAAMKAGYSSIHSELPISEKLYYNLTYQVIPQLYAMGAKKLSRIQLDVPLTEGAFHGKRVACGMSRGVDSFATMYEYCKYFPIDAYKINTFTYFQTGAHHGWDASLGQSDESKQELYERQMEKTREFCRMYGYPLLVVESNIDALLTDKAWFREWSFDRTHTMRNLAIALLFQKGMSKYYYSSAYLLTEFLPRVDSDMAHYERWLIPLLSTDSIEMYQSNQDWTRMDKVEKISQLKESYDYLHVCLTHSISCGVCAKCKRTLMELDSLGDEVLERYHNSFDLDAYRRNNRKKWFDTLIIEKDKKSAEAHFYDEIFVSAAKHHRELLGEFLREKNPNIKKVVVPYDGVNIRPLPSLRSEILFTSKKGDTFEYLGEVGIWVGIRTASGEEAFVVKSYSQLLP